MARQPLASDDAEFDEIDDEFDPDPEDQEDEEQEGEDEDDLEPAYAEDEGDEEEEPPQRPARKSFAQRVEEVAARKVAQELKKLQAQNNRPAQPQGETAQQRHDRLAAMEPWERTEFLTNERMARLEWEGSDRIDRMEFNSTCREDPVARSLKDDVEARLAEYRNAGFNSTRDAIYTLLLGERARENRGRAEGKARKTAAANRERQTTRPGNSRGDASSEGRRGNTTSARDKRLENMSI